MTKHLCPMCNREVTRIPLAGKRFFPHKCAHGTWCVSGNKYLGTHANHPTCMKCQKLAREQ